MDDAIDKKMLGALTQDARAGWAEIAAEVGLTGPAVAERVKKLRGQGVGFALTADPRSFGLALTAFVSVSVGSSEARKAVLAAVARLGAVTECHHVTGDDDYLLKIICRDTAELEQILTHDLKGAAADIRTKTIIALNPVKAPRMVLTPERFHD